MGIFKRVALAIVVAFNLAFAAVPAAPALAASGPTTISFASVSPVTPGGSFSVDLNISTTGQSLGYQFAVNYDPAVLTLTAVTAGSWLNNYITANCSSSFPQPWLPVVSPGLSKVGALAGLGCTGNGPTGTGQLATLSFTAAAGANAVTAPFLSSVVVSGINATDLTVNTGSITVGTPPVPNLVPMNATTTAVTGTPTQFNVSFLVKNTGTAPANASTASLAITGATPVTATVSVPALAAGASSSTLSSGPFTLNSGSTLANVTITDQNVATTAYSFSAFTSTGNTTIGASLAGTLVLTAPPSIANFVLTPGKTNSDPDGNLSVLSNLSSFQVTVADANPANNGHFTEFDPGTSSFVTGGAQLGSPLNVQLDSTTTSVNLSGAAQAFVSATRAQYPPSGPSLFPVTFNQLVTFNDPAVNPPHEYEEVVTFAAAGTF